MGAAAHAFAGFVRGINPLVVHAGTLRVPWLKQSRYPKHIPPRLAEVFVVAFENAEDAYGPLTPHFPLLMLKANPVLLR
jgi:hypothetical protein